MSSSDDHQLHRIDAVGGIALPDEIDIPKVATDKKAGFDFLGQVKHMAEQAQQQRAEQGLAVALGKPMEINLVELKAEELIDTVGRLLQQAWDLINASEYEAAIDCLEQLLAESPGHHEAIYAKAFALANLNKHELALETLLPLRTVRLERQIDDRVKALSALIRPFIVLAVLRDVLLLITADRNKECVQRLQRAVTLDPDVGLFHFILAGSLMNAEQFSEALAAVDNGMAHCSREEQDQLNQLKAEIQKRLLLQAMQPARALYRRAKYSEASSALRRVDRAYQRVPLFVVFDKYLEQLAGGGFLGMFGNRRTPQTVAPSGAPKDVDSLYFFLVREEIEQAKKLLDNDHNAQAERVLAQALQCTPHFPFVNYLYGASVLKHLLDRARSKQLPGLETMLAELERARTFARVGILDKEITDAPALLETIEKFLSILQETKLVNEANTEFNEIIELVGDGIRSPDHYKRVYERLNALKQRLPALQRSLTNSEAQERCNQLAKAVQRNFAQLESMSTKVKEAEIIDKHYQTFKEIMDGIGTRGVTTYQQAMAVQAALRRLRDAARADHHHLRNSEARENLNKLVEHLNELLAQFER